jgi:eukaryotic-like serine/threonine-protein kinase
VKYCPLCGKEYEDGETCPRDGAVLVRTRQGADPLIGQVLKGTYRIEAEIGAGGMGAVFRGVQIPLERDVAIKVLLPSAQSAPSMISRFFQEAKLLSQLSHPNVVGIIDFGNTDSGMIYMVMEHLAGRTLGAHVPAEEGLPLAEAAHWMRQACAGVGAAHRCRLVHRDLKPENLFLATSLSAPETLKVLDFGVARALEGRQETRLTQAGLLMGTPGFIAPEQIESPADADARSDIYALGAILFFMVTGHRPYHGLTPHSILVQQMQRPPALDLGALADLPGVAAVIGKAMARDPAARYPSTDELVAALDEAVAAPGRAPRPAAGAAPPIGSPPPAAGGPPGRQATAGPPPEPTVLASGGAPRRARPSRRALLPALAAAGLLAAALLAWWWWPGRKDRRTAREATAGAAAAGAVPTNAAPTRGVTADRITIGMSAAFSGPAKELGRNMQIGIETCFRDLDDGGGIHGRQLELVALDDGYEPDRTVSNMLDLLLKRKVFAVLGNVGTPTAEVALPLALEQQVPFLGAFTGADLLRRQPPDRYVFNYRASYDEETAAIVRHFIEKRGLQPSEIAVFAQDDGFGDAGYDGVGHTLEHYGHTEPVLRVGYRRNSIDVEEAVDGLVRRRADVRGVVMVATYRAAAEFIHQIEDAGLDLILANLSFVGSRALAEELKQLGPQYAEGVIVTQVVPHFESAAPGVARYRELLARYFPAEEPGFVSLEGYLAARVFTEGLIRAGADLSVEGFVDTLESMDHFDLGTGAEAGFSTANHQASNRVWGTVLDASGTYRTLDL